MPRRHRTVLIVVSTLAPLLLVAHLLLPLFIRDYLNSRLQDMGNYHGHIEDIDLALWRGAYRINGLTITRTDADIPVPFFEAPETALQISWPALWRGAVVARVHFVSPRLNFVDGGDQAAGQSGEGVDWRTRLEQLVPMRIDELSIEDGRIHFQNFFSDPPVDVAIHSLDGEILNLRNTRDAEGTRVATLTANGLLEGSAPVETRVQLDPFGALDDFDLQLRITDLDLTSLNDIAAAYGHFDFVSGQGDFVMELTAQERALSGYAKPLFHDMDIFSWEQDVEDDDQSLLSAGWEALVGGLTTLFRNQPEQQFATRVPIEGSLDDTEVSRLRAISAILRNAFVEAYKPWFEEQTGQDR